MTAADILVVLVFVTGVLYWWNATRTKEIARRGGRRACENAEVYFLDDTVAISNIRLRWDDRGRLKFYRKYKFEFTSDGSYRYSGEIIVFGKEIERVTMEPYRLPRDN